MSACDSSPEFEHRLRELLERQTDAAGGHVRSQLTQARHAALLQAGEHRGVWREVLAGRRRWVPAAGVLAAAVAAGVLLLGPHRADRSPPSAGATAVTAQDLPLLTDRDGLAMLEDGGGQFYEWAAVQGRGGAVSGAAADGPSEHGG
jgi:hypothetical protein